MELSVPNAEASAVIEQLIGLGRGIELNDSRFPGLVLADSPDSHASYDRAVTTGRYDAAHPEVDTVVFSGSTSFLVPDEAAPYWGEDAMGEGTGMAMVGSAVNPNLNYQVEKDARTTVGNFVLSVLTGKLDPNKPTGIVVDEQQRRNAVWAARLVMPQTVLKVISPYDNPDLVATDPDVKLSDAPDRQPTLNDRISGAVYRVAMRGITPGDLPAIQARDELVQRVVLAPIKVMRGLKAAVRSVIPKSEPLPTAA